MKKFIIGAFVSLFALTAYNLAEAKGYYMKFNEKESKMNFFLSTNLHSVDGQVQKFKGSINIKASDDDTIDSADGALDIMADSLFTNHNQRDGKMKTDVLGISKFPLIKFKVTGAKITGNKLAQENLLYMKLIGTLTIRDTTKNVEIPVKVKLSTNRSSAQVEGKYNLSFKDYNVPDPSIPIIGQLNENISISFNLKAY